LHFFNLAHKPLLNNDIQGTFVFHGIGIEAAMPGKVWQVGGRYIF
jgi:hypothetical protein